MEDRVRCSDSVVAFKTQMKKNNPAVTFPTTTRCPSSAPVRHQLHQLGVCPSFYQLSLPLVSRTLTRTKNLTSGVLLTPGVVVMRGGITNAHPSHRICSVARRPARQCDALAKVLLGNLDPCRPRGRYYDNYQSIVAVAVHPYRLSTKPKWFRHRGGGPTLKDSRKCCYRPGGPGWGGSGLK